MTPAWPAERVNSMPSDAADVPVLYTSGLEITKAKMARDFAHSMCGRSTYKLTWEEFVRLYQLALDQPAPRHNVCPTTTIDTVVGQNGNRQLVPMRWGPVPSWWSTPALRRLPKNRRSAARSSAHATSCRERGGDITGVVVALRLVLELERVPCLPQ